MALECCNTAFGCHSATATATATATDTDTATYHLYYLFHLYFNLIYFYISMNLRKKIKTIKIDVISHQYYNYNTKLTSNATPHHRINGYCYSKSSQPQQPSSDLEPA